MHVSLAFLLADEEAGVRVVGALSKVRVVPGFEPRSAGSKAHALNVGATAREIKPAMRITAGAPATAPFFSHHVAQVSSPPLQPSPPWNHLE